MDNELHIPKRTGTHADTFFVIGVADLLADFYPEARIRICDAGGEFVVKAPGPALATLRQKLRHRTGYRYISEKGEAAPAGMPVCHYEQERAGAQKYRESAEALRKEGKQSAEIQQLLQDAAPQPDWRRIQAVRLLQGHLTANKLSRNLMGLDLAVLREQVASGLERLTRGVPSGVAWKVEQVQVFNPPAAKGYSRIKPDSTDRNDGTGDAWGDPLVEWCRMRGYYRVATPFYLGSKGEHIRLLTPIPGDVSLNTLQVLCADLPRTGIRSTSEAKLDALAAIALARLLVDRCEENQAPSAPPLPGNLLLGKRPSTVIQGIHITHYQSLGQSRAVGSLQRLALPGWFLIQGPDDVRDWLHILDEHRAALQSLDDQHSDEIGILLAYRRFLQNPEEEGAASVAEAFLEFLGQYGCFYIRAREQKRYAKQFLTANVRRVLMGVTDTYTQILDDPGFAAVADAVRRATVNAQAQKAMGNTGFREIRYDLLPELRRKRATSADEFMEVVSEFVSQYNAENSRRWEMKRSAPRNITTEEFHAFAGLVERNGAAKVGALLCAFGTCRDSGDAAAAPAPDEPSEAGSENP